MSDAAEFSNAEWVAAFILELRNVLRANDEAMQRWMKSKKCLLETHETTLTTLGLPELYKVYRLLFPTEAPQKFWSQLGPICSLMNVELLGTDPLRVLEMDNREREKLRVCFCFGEFVKNVALLSRTGDLRSRLRFLFDMFDEDQDGFLTVRDLRRMLATHASANKFLLSTDQLHELVEKIFTRLLMLDPKGTSSIAGCVSFDDFQLMFQPVFDRLDCSSWAPIQATTDKELGFKLMPNPTGVNRTDLRRVLNPERPVSLVRPIPSGNLVDERGPKQTRWKKWRDRIVYYAVQDGVRSVSYAVFTIVNLALFIYQIIASLGTDYYKAMGPMYSIAVASAICLNFNVAFIFLTMSRSFLALLRRIPLICRIFPFDHHVQFHRITGYLIVVLSLMHTGAHVFGNFITLSTPRTFSNPNNSFTHNFNGGQPMPYWQLLFATIPGATGLGMLLVLGCILGTSFKAVRTRNYELFFYVHHLFFVFVMLLLVHKNARYFGDPSTWKWIVGPGAIYLIGFFWRWAGSWLRKTSLVRAYFRKANVLSVEVLKPRAALQHRPGEYYFLNVPQLSPFQWHAFTTTASPLEDVLRFHIGCSGDWTSALADLLRSSETPPRILLDGPFGAPADRVYRYEYVMLIGTGSGATPFASVLQDLRLRLERKDGHSVKVKQLDFYWVIKDQPNGRWMTALLSDFLDDLGKLVGAIRLHVFLTGVHRKRDLRSYLLWQGIELVRDETQVNILTGIPGRAYWGRPNWDVIFQQTRDNATTGQTVGVFFCGAKGLAKQLYGHCWNYSVNSPTRFVFHKENF